MFPQFRNHIHFLFFKVFNFRILAKLFIFWQNWEPNHNKLLFLLTNKEISFEWFPTITLIQFFWCFSLLCREPERWERIWQLEFTIYLFCKLIKKKKCLTPKYCRHATEKQTKQTQHLSICATSESILQQLIYIWWMIQL